MPVFLTAEQKAALDAAPGQPLEVFDATGARYLIVAADGLIDPGGSFTGKEEVAWQQAGLDACWRAGWDAPEMAEYDNYDENYRKRFGHDPR